MSKREKILIIFVVALVVFAAGRFLWQKRAADGGVNLHGAGATESRKENTVAPTKQTYEYINEDYGFLLELPDGFGEPQVFEENGGQMLIFAEAGAKNKNMSSREFQIFITEFDEVGPLTPERIKKDIPDAVIENPQQALIGKQKNIPALIYIGDGGAKKTREIWFAHGGYLYQATGYLGLDSMLADIFGTLLF